MAEVVFLAPPMQAAAERKQPGARHAPSHQNKAFDRASSLLSATKLLNLTSLPIITKNISKPENNLKRLVVQVLSLYVLAPREDMQAPSYQNKAFGRASALLSSTNIFNKLGNLQAMAASSLVHVRPE